MLLSSCESMLVVFLQVRPGKGTSVPACPSATSEDACGQDPCPQPGGRTCGGPLAGGGWPCGCRIQLRDSVCPKAAAPCAWRRPGEVNSGPETTVPSSGRREWLWAPGGRSQREKRVSPGTRAATRALTSD